MIYILIYNFLLILYLTFNFVLIFNVHCHNLYNKYNNYMGLEVVTSSLVRPGNWHRFSFYIILSNYCKYYIKNKNCIRIILEWLVFENWCQAKNYTNFKFKFKFVIVCLICKFWLFCKKFRIFIIRDIIYYNLFDYNLNFDSEQL